MSKPKARPAKSKTPTKAARAKKPPAAARRPATARPAAAATRRPPNVPVSRYMTASVHTIGIDQSLLIAHEVMRANHIRHLPVLDEGELVGVVSIGDLHLIETLKDVKPEVVTVEEAMVPDPYVVAPSTSLGAVATHMAEHKLGAALIVDGGKVAGMFTGVDALKALAGLLGK